jgi:ribosomal protein S18 acetylase RimI-like enzyme
MGKNKDEKPDILVLAPPAPAEVKRLLGLYKLWDKAHAAGPWARDLALRLGVRQDGAHDRFYLAPHGAKIAAALDVSRSERPPGVRSAAGSPKRGRAGRKLPGTQSGSGFGVVHRVFTHPKMRRHGYAAELISRAKADFRAAGGRILLVVAPGSGRARAFYESQGFREIVRARDGEAMLGWAARGRHVREAALRMLKPKASTWRPADAGDWAGLIAYSALPGGRPDVRPETFLDAEWGEVFERLAIQRALPDEPEDGEAKQKLVLEVGESRRGFVVAARASGAVPKWLKTVAGSAQA